jgi:hypothetical protein
MLSSGVARRSLLCGKRVALVTLKRQQQQQYAPHTPRRFTATTTNTTTTVGTNVASKATKETLNKQTIWQKLKERPIEYATVPCVAAFVGIMTNWMGVKMLFYPIEYVGTNWYREEMSPYGYFGWQGPYICGTFIHVMQCNTIQLGSAERNAYVWCLDTNYFLLSYYTHYIICSIFTTGVVPTKTKVMRNGWSKIWNDC